MQPVLAIFHMFPDANLNNTEVFIDANGDWEITKWELPCPQPTKEEIKAYWNEHQLEILDLKLKKKSSLSEQCNIAIVSGFKSSALGIEHTYPSDMEAQANFNSTINRFLTDPSFTTISFKTLDAGYLEHTKEQFFQVFKDGHTYGDKQIEHLNELKSKVDEARTQDDLDLIVW